MNWNVGWLVLLFVVPSAAWAKGVQQKPAKGSATEADTNTDSEKEPKKERKPEVVETVERTGVPVSYSLGVGADIGYMTTQPNNPGIEQSRSGMYSAIFGLITIQQQDVVFDLGIGWGNASLKVDNIQAAIDALDAEGITDEDKREASAKAINTSYGIGEFAARMRWDGLQAGLVLDVGFGVDTSFGSNVEDATPNLFVGPEIIFQHDFNERNALFSRAGLKLVTDVSIAERQVYILAVNVALGMPIAKPETIIKERTEIKTEVRYKTKIKKEVVHRYQDRYLIDAGIVHFVTGKSDLNNTIESYLRALSQYLTDHAQQWDKILIVAHTDVRGGAKLNEKLSMNRANKVADIFKFSGIGSEKIEIKSLSFADPVMEQKDKVSYARNRRVELTILGGAEIPMLKNDILKLQQRYQMPSTCEGDTCF